jgi:hypothetical protein
VRKAKRTFVAGGVIRPFGAEIKGLERVENCLQKTRGPEKADQLCERHENKKKPYTA